MTKVKVVNKYINALPIQNLINQNESLVDDIYFYIDNYVDGVDFSEWSWRLYYKTPLDDGHTTLLESEYDSENQQVVLHWVPDSDVSRKTGYITIQLRGSKDTDAGLLRWNSAVATIHVSRALQANDEVQKESILEEYLDRMEQLCQSGLLDYQSLVESLTEEHLRAVERENELQAEIDRLKSLVQGG